MADPSNLRPATANEIAETLSFALRYKGRKRVHDADQVMGRISANHSRQNTACRAFVT